MWDIPIRQGFMFPSLTGEQLSLEAVRRWEEVFSLLRGPGASPTWPAGASCPVWTECLVCEAHRLTECVGSDSRPGCFLSKHYFNCNLSRHQTKPSRKPVLLQGSHRKKNAECVQVIHHDVSPSWVPGSGLKAKVKKIKNKYTHKV